LTQLDLPSNHSVKQGSQLVVRQLGLRPYLETWQAMREFTDNRTPQTLSELWMLEHPPVFTQGQAGKPEHLLNPGEIPVVQSDRGGQVTYHGPGQLIIYLMLNLKQINMGIRQLVTVMESAVIHLLSQQGIEAKARADAPGVYVDGKKIAALGLRVRRGNTYHGLALNVDMDLEPFTRINPCGMVNLGVTQTHDLGIDLSLEETGEQLIEHLCSGLGSLQYIEKV